MQPSSQNLPRGGIYSLQKSNRKFDFRSACNKIPKTTAFICILTLISGIFYMKSLFFCVSIEFTFSKRNLILQSGIYFFNSPFFPFPFTSLILGLLEAVNASSQTSLVTIKMESFVIIDTHLVSRYNQP